MQDSIYFAGVETPRAVFNQSAKSLATVLSDHGVGEDDSVAILMRNDVAYFETIEACRYVGAHYVTLNWHGAAAEIEQILQDSGAKVLVGHSDLTQKISQLDTVEIPVISKVAPGSDSATLALQIDYDDCIERSTPITTDAKRLRGLLAYTSGSTGRPKGIIREDDLEKPDGYLRYAGLAKAILQLSEGDRFFTAAPVYHSAPNALSYFCLAAGFAQVHLAPKFNPEDFLAYIERFKITHIYIVPTMMVRLLKLPKSVRERYDVSSLKFSISTGSAWPQDVKTAMIDWFGPIFYESYGASEIGFMTLISSEEAALKPGSVGKVLPGGSLQILGEDGAPVPTGEPGLIYVYLPMFGDFTYSNVTGDLKDQRSGQHTTVGDIGYVDADGYLYISDRKKDMIISGGANIFPAEIEAALIKMPQVLDCAVFGAPHPEFGECVIAAIQSVDGEAVALPEVQTFLEGKIARFKFPQHIDMHEGLPREDSGKIFKQRLRAPYWEGKDKQV